jgi:hypothetical protein
MITWHVDDLNMLHMEYNEVKEIIGWLEGIYGDIKVSSGNKHDYLGMTLDFTKKREVNVNMMYYLKGFLEYFPKIITGWSATPTSENLLQVHPMTSGSSLTPLHNCYLLRQGHGKTFKPTLHSLRQRSSSHIRMSAQVHNDYDIHTSNHQG